MQGALTMKTALCAVLLLLTTPWTLAAPASPQHYHVLKKIAEYVNASDRCGKAAQAQGLPGDDVIDELRRYSSADVERFLITRGLLMQKQCERPELTDLAYTILIHEGVELEKETQDAIEAIKVLAFPSTIRKSEQLYQSLPEDMRNSFERFEYFNSPFDNRKVRDLLQGQ